MKNEKKKSDSRTFAFLLKAVKFAFAVFMIGTLSFGSMRDARASGLSTTGSNYTCYPICDIIGTPALATNAVYEAFIEELKAAAGTVEMFIGEAVDTMMQVLLTRLNLTEMNLIDWWNTMWYYNMRPSMQAMTEQINTAMTDQARIVESFIDAEQQVQTHMEQSEQQVRAHRDMRASENVCVAGTAAGGYSRASNLGRRMREGWEYENKRQGLNSSGAVGDDGAAEVSARIATQYENIFCDPNANGGKNLCGPGATDPVYYDADTQVTKFLYNDLTIDVDADPRNAQVIEAIIDNMVGEAAADPISKASFQSATGQETFLNRRSMLARHNAVRSIPQLIAGWRMPGSKAGVWVEQLRKDAGIPLSDISDNPSYLEVLHAATVDRFNSGRYANYLIVDEAAVELEKLTQSAFYLMQLRDYFELLERTALVLSVQVAMYVEQVPLADGSKLSPLR